MEKVPSQTNKQKRTWKTWNLKKHVWKHLVVTKGGHNEWQEVLKLALLWTLCLCLVCHKLKSISHHCTLSRQFLSNCMHIGIGNKQNKTMKNSWGQGGSTNRMVISSSARLFTHLLHGSPIHPSLAALGLQHSMYSSFLSNFSTSCS